MQKIQNRFDQIDSNKLEIEEKCEAQQKQIESLLAALKQKDLKIDFLTNEL